MNLYYLNTCKVEKNRQINKLIKFLPEYIKLEENYQRLILFIENNLSTGYNEEAASMRDCSNLQIYNSILH